MATDMTPEERLALVKSGLPEILHGEILEQVILKEQRPLEIYWGTATTGRPHIAYFVPTLHIAKFLRAGCKVTVLLADTHGFLDNLKAPIELVEHRAQYYKKVTQCLLRAVGVPLSSVEFILGSDYQYSRPYRFDLDKLLTQITVNAAQHAGAEVVKQTGTSPLLSSLQYTLMQALDEEYLKVDAQFGGVDQRKIFAFAQDVLPKIGYKVRAHLMNTMMPGLAGGKMSASDPNSKIDLLDTPEQVTKKLRKAECAQRVTEGNGIIGLVEHILLPFASLSAASHKGEFTVDRHEGDPLIYTDIAQLKSDFESDVLTPQLLKPAVTKALNAMLAPIQAEFQNSKEWQELEARAYPVEKKPEKPFKKNKKANVHVKPDGGVEGKGKEAVELGVAVEKLSV
jgi:tyrosyl-tRNA synthetase